MDAMTGKFNLLSGLNLDPDRLLLTNEYVSVFLTYYSPIHDGKFITEQLDDYIRNRNQDSFGAARRTGSIKRVHEGVDLFVRENTPLYPMCPFGVVTEAIDDPDHVIRVKGVNKKNESIMVNVEYGKIVRILYPSGLESLYAHLNTLNVKTGDTVFIDTIVGMTGYTGNIRESGKPSHLHLEIRDKDFKPIDPYIILSTPPIELQHFLNIGGFRKQINDKVIVTKKLSLHPLTEHVEE